jgi:hypothetical protein
VGYMDMVACKDYKGYMVGEWSHKVGDIILDASLVREH